MRGCQIARFTAIEISPRAGLGEVWPFDGMVAECTESEAEESFKASWAPSRPNQVFRVKRGSRRDHVSIAFERFGRLAVFLLDLRAVFFLKPFRRPRCLWIHSVH